MINQEKKYIIGERVMINAPESCKFAKFNNLKDEIKNIACKWNQIPIVKLDNGKELAIEGRYLIHWEQPSLF